jgi:succinate dehydrogenase/fumarate reductase cytochrome b subunit
VSHLGDDELVLHYYGEDGPGIVAAERHLQSCEECARAYEMLARTLSAITPPELPDVADEMPTLRQLVRERLNAQPSRARVNLQPSRGQAGVAALVWLVPLLYPLSSRALFGSATLTHEHVAGLPLVALTLLWTLAGPFVSVFALNRMPAVGVERTSTRLLVSGALVAAISPPLYVLMTRLTSGLQWWYGAVALASLVPLFRWPKTSRSAESLLYVHRLSALVITVFVLTHIGNQVFGFVSLSAYATTLNILRVGYHQPVIESLLLASAAIQIATGAAMGVRKVRGGALTENLKAITGWYLAVFLMTHVFLGLLLSPHQTPAPAAAIAASQFNLLASARGAAQLPFLLLGVVAFLFHVGAYARLTALAFLAEATVRRLSYAAMFVGTTVVVTVGLALCGIHLIR